MASGGTCGCSAGWSDVACKCILQPGAPTHQIRNRKQQRHGTCDICGNMCMVFVAYLIHVFLHFMNFVIFGIQLAVTA